MTEKVGGSTNGDCGDCGDINSVLAGSEIDTRSEDRAGFDTETTFETAVLNFVNHGVGPNDRPQIALAAKSRSQLVSPQSNPTRSVPTNRKIANPAVAPIAIAMTAAGKFRDASADDRQPIQWRVAARGMPSWLTSLIFHVAVIMILAVVSVGDGGRRVIALLATANESVEIEFDVSIDMPALKPVEPLAKEIEMPAPKLIDSSDISQLLDEALQDAALESQPNRDMFERISTAGISESDLPRRLDQGGTQFFGVEGKGSNFVFVIDCSGSMADYGRWNQAVREVKKSVLQLKQDQKFLILLYNDGFVAMNPEAELVPSTQIQQKKAFKWLSNNSPGSWTFCAAAMGKALSLQPDAVFLLSDGEFNDREDVFAVLESMNSLQDSRLYAQRQIPIHTIALGSHRGSWTMKKIADENNGNFQLIE